MEEHSTGEGLRQTSVTETISQTEW